MFKNFFSSNNNNQIDEVNLISNIIEKSDNVIIITDANGLISWVNQAFTDFTGYSFHEIKGTKFWDFLQNKNEDIHSLGNILEKLTKNEPFREKIMNYDKEGTPYYMELNVNPVLDSKGQISNFVILGVDKTEDIINKQKLEQQYSQLKAYNEAINTRIGFIEFDLNRRILTVNEKLASLLGYTTEELIGKNHRSLVGDLMTDETYQAFWNNLLKEGKAESEFQRKHKNGQIIWLQAVYIVVKDTTTQEPKSVIKLAIDITERKQQEQQLREKNEELLAIEEELRQNIEEMETIQEKLVLNQIELKGQINALNNAALVSETDIRGNIIFANQTFSSVSGYSVEELLGKNHRILKSGKQNDSIFVEMWATISSGKVWRGIICNKKKNGSFYWVNATITPVLDNHGVIIKYIGVRFEITVQIEQQIQLEEKNQELLASEEELRMAQEELNAINEDLKIKTEALEKSLENIRNAQNQLRSLSMVAANTDNAVIITNANREIEWVNPGFTRISGYTFEEVKGKIPSRILQGKDTDPQTVQRIREKLQLKTSFREEILNYRKDGKPYWISLNITPILNEVGEVEKYIAIEMDITEKKEKEKLIQERNKDLEDSLRYAKSILNALLPNKEILKSNFKDSFVYFQPKEEIGGDFYWIKQYDEILCVVVADCTGHGVPGALLSIYFQQYLNNISNQYAKVEINKKIGAIQEGILNIQKEYGFKDAFEISLAMFNSDKIYLFSTIAQPIIIQKNNDLIEILKFDNYLGYHPLKSEKANFNFMEFNKKEIKKLFLMSDGIIDQFGGPENKKFGLTRLKSIIAGNADAGLAQTIKEIKFSLNTWFNGQEQTDDFLMIGLEL